MNRTLWITNRSFLFINVLYTSWIISLRNILLPVIPRNSFLKLDATATEDVECAANRQVNLAAAQFLHQLQVLQVASAACVCDRDGADGGQELHELGVDTGLFAFDVGSVDQELCAVGLEESDVFLSSQWELWSMRVDEARQN